MVEGHMKSSEIGIDGAKKHRRALVKRARITK